MLRTNNRCVASLNISVEVAKCGKFSQIHPEHSHLSVTKNDLSRLNNLLMVRFQHIRMLSYVEVANCGNIHKITQYTHFLCVTKNDKSCLNNLFMVAFNSLGCSLKLRTNYRCVESLNFNVEVDKTMWKIFIYSPSKLIFCLND